MVKIKMTCASMNYRVLSHGNVFDYNGILINNVLFVTLYNFLLEDLINISLYNYEL